ncbi:uncharacterized protein LOC114446552 [Parambassis ranga]|uniref:Uncharacterized protein LOC114446552 n=1 Tax=Parambassis ranga TaxID=210632 RepID=A0A6P7JR95_9TELE|nr:uncharacterized protein LOC114446552 [Parambassis ranga]
MNLPCHKEAFILICFIVYCAESSAPSPSLQRNKYNNSFHLTRSTRTRVQQLLRKYKKQQLGDEDFEDRSRQLKDLPSLSTDFYSWLKMTDLERLHAAFLDMQAYWNMLEWKRRQLEKEEKEQLVVQAPQTTLPQSIKHVQLDLRDLMRQVSSQMTYVKSSVTKPVTAPVLTLLKLESSSKTVWDSRVEGYIILRDLDLYLTKLARDFLLLASKTHS